MGLVDRYNRPLATTNFKKAEPPKLGEAFGPNWAGSSANLVKLPGGQMLLFDLDRLTLQDYRNMRTHYQINASLSVLSFMLHQIDWHIECEDKKIADEVERQLRLIWTRLMRGMSQAFWAGYSPNILQWENNVPERRVELTKIKDLYPEDCTVNWKKVEGYAPPGYSRPKINVYDGINIIGSPFPVPVDNTFWYPLLMENGDYYGKKLLKPAFPAWFFSMLIHLYANRYFERFGEPLPIGRAPFDATVKIGEQEMSGREAMNSILADLRNRSVVTLPSDRDPDTKEFDWDLDYLESQMRGADFERYLSRLDEEMSLGLFTPVLLFRTADVGSYNLGVSHMQVFLWMLNALAGDMKEYIDKYICERIKAICFSPKAPRVQWMPRKMGKENVELFRGVITELVRGGLAKPDLEELGQAAGLTLKEVRQITQDDDPDDPDQDNRTQRDRPGSDGPKGVGEPRATTREISARIASQVTKAFKNGTFGAGFQPDLGFRRKFESSLLLEGASADKAHELTDQFYSRVSGWLSEAIELGTDYFHGPADFVQTLNRVLDSEVEALR